jgi:single-stranded-DNA-specific exonuclease
MIEPLQRYGAGVVPEIVAKILSARGMSPDEMGVFLYPEYDRDMHDPTLLTDMGKAIGRIERAISTGSRLAQS